MSNRQLNGIDDAGMKTAGAFCLMQDSPIDKAMYYDALPTRTYCGLYYFPSCRVTKTYYSFRAFNELYRLGTEVESECAGFDELYLRAASDTQGKNAVLIVNRKNEKREVPLTLPGVSGEFSHLLLDSSHLLTETDCSTDDGKLKRPSLSVLLLRMQMEK